MKSRLLNVLAAAIALAIPVLAHHSFTMFDTTKQITITGTVSEFQWTNPHSYIEIDVPDESGALKHWSIEMGSPSILQQSGWKFSSLKKGDKTTLVINPLKTGLAGGFLNTATLPNGKILGNGPGRGPAK
jgi:hypothetical protein